MDDRQVGVIGLGNMGLGMASRLAGSGFRVTGFDRDPARRALAATRGIAPADTQGAALRAGGIVLTSLPRAADVAAVLTGPDGLGPRRDAPVLVIDTSTGDPQSARALAARLAEAGHALLDAPVSGGPAGAAAGTLTVMAGGTDADLARAQPVLAALAARVMHVGGIGAGTVAKLVNNMLVAIHLAAAGEALRLSEAAGLPAADALRVVNAATGRSQATEAMVPRWVLPGAFDSGFGAALMKKDIGLAVGLGATLGLDLGLATRADGLWADLVAADPGADFTRIAAFDPASAEDPS